MSDQRETTVDFPEPDECQISWDQYRWLTEHRDEILARAKQNLHVLALAQNVHLQEDDPSLSDEMRKEIAETREYLRATNARLGWSLTCPPK